MPRLKSSMATAVPIEAIRALARAAKKAQESHSFESQDELATFLGVTQPIVSRLFATIDEPSSNKRPKKRVILPGPDSLAAIANRFGFTPGHLFDGTIIAQGDRLDAMHPNRGAALFFLSDEVSPEIIEALRQYEVPKGADGWTRVRWLDHLRTLKLDWESGRLQLPGLTRK